MVVDGNLQKSSVAIQSLRRWRAGLVVAAVLIPLGLWALFERQARRLDALSSHGEPVQAWVTGVSGDKGTTFYAYRVEGKEYSWNVARKDAPYAVGQGFPSLYVPENPSFSQPFADRALVAQKAAGNRSFAWKVCSGVAVLFFLLAGVAHRDLQRRRAGVVEVLDPGAYKRRLRGAILLFLLVLLLVGGFHFKDALGRGESIVLVLLGLAVGAAIVGGGYVLATRAGPQKTRLWAATITRWVVPISLGLALLRLVVYFLKP
jgi:hypothetical protein